MAEPGIVILLSVYGEAPFLKEFLASLKEQSCRNFRLRYRFDDDGKDAEYREILARFPRAETSGRNGHVGVALSYQKLLQEAGDAAYLMFADQDDVWHPEKVEKSYACMKQSEARFGRETPLLVHSDLRVCDQNLREIAPSFFRYQALNPERQTLRDLMIQNNVTGCTMMINRALADQAAIPAEAICHDWYLALTAATFGRIVCLQEVLTDYRQHSGNVYGAVPRRRMLPELFHKEELHRRLMLTQHQAAAFLHQYAGCLREPQRTLLEAWSGMSSEPSWLRRLGIAWKYRFTKNDFLRTLGLWWAL